MKVQFQGLIKILHRRLGWMYSREEIIRLVYAEGANHLDKDVTYLGFGYWEVKQKENEQ